MTSTTSEALPTSMYTLYLFVTFLTLTFAIAIQRRSTPHSCLDHTLNETCHDDVDLTLCFEDTAILYLICASLWFLAGLEFLTTKRKSQASIPLSVLNVSRIVR